MRYSGCGGCFLEKLPDTFNFPSKLAVKVPVEGIVSDLIAFLRGLKQSKWLKQYHPTSKFD